MKLLEQSVGGSCDKLWCIKQLHTLVFSQYRASLELCWRKHIHVTLLLLIVSDKIPDFSVNFNCILILPASKLSHIIQTLLAR